MARLVYDLVVPGEGVGIKITVPLTLDLPQAAEAIVVSDFLSRRSHDKQPFSIDISGRKLIGVRVMSMIRERG